ncbi:MAG: hemolysin family protein [Oscillospiraceae bacterium]|jgi:putative hemolysin|nr:hemolysin family protein [Oscillospiraceae bacterium]
MDGDRSRLSKGLSRLLKFTKESVNEQDILQLVENKNADIEESEREIISNVFEWTDTSVTEIMTHRTDVIAVSVNTDILNVVKTAIDEGCSRIPVYEKDIDKIIGVIYVKDLLVLIGNELKGQNVKSFMREVMSIPNTSKCKDTFELMRKEKTQFAVVVDEYGGTEGIVTIEDLLEELVGNIQDEYDNEETDISKKSNNVFIIDGTASPDDIAETLNLELPDNHEYETMNAMLIDLLGRVPEDNEIIKLEYQNVHFTSLKIEDNFIAQIEAVINEEKYENCN